MGGLIDREQVVGQFQDGGHGRESAAGMGAGKREVALVQLGERSLDGGKEAGGSGSIAAFEAVSRLGGMEPDDGLMRGPEFADQAREDLLAVGASAFAGLMLIERFCGQEAGLPLGGVFAPAEAQHITPDIECAAGLSALLHADADPVMGNRGSRVGAVATAEGFVCFLGPLPAASLEDFLDGPPIEIGLGGWRGFRLFLLLWRFTVRFGKNGCGSKGRKEGKQKEKEKGVHPAGINRAHHRDEPGGGGGGGSGHLPGRGGINQPNCRMAGWPGGRVAGWPGGRVANFDFRISSCVTPIIRSYRSAQDASRY